MSKLKTVAWEFHGAGIAGVTKNYPNGVGQAIVRELCYLSDAQAEIDQLEESVRAERAVSERLLEALKYVQCTQLADWARQTIRNTIAEVEAMRAKEVR